MENIHEAGACILSCHGKMRLKQSLSCCPRHAASGCSIMSLLAASRKHACVLLCVELIQQLNCMALLHEQLSPVLQRWRLQLCPPYLLMRCER